MSAEPDFRRAQRADLPDVVRPKLFAWAIERARSKGCRMVQLTSDKARADAIRFYESLGFVASHEGLKLHFK